MDCADCMSVEKCCGKLHADGSCCGNADRVTLQCPPCSMPNIDDLLVQLCDKMGRAA